MLTKFHSTHLKKLLHRLRQKVDDSCISMEELKACEEELTEGELLVQALIGGFAELKPFTVALSNEESAFHSLINVMPDLVFQKDLTGCYVNCNESFAKYVGRRRLEIRGLRPRHLYPPHIARVLEEDDNKVFMFRKTVRNEAWATDAEGNRAFFDTVKTPYYGADGELLGLIGVSRDITKRYEMEEKLRELATTDELTGLFNRRTIMQKAKTEVSRAIRYRRPLSVLMLDVDHFKSINDTHGHDMGDEALQQVAHCCRSSLRESDFLGRYGGEEFLVILPETFREDAFVLAERLREKLAHCPIRHLGVVLSVTLSVGLSCLYLERPDTLDALLKRADVALYQAKARGRNRTVQG